MFKKIIIPLFILATNYQLLTTPVSAVNCDNPGSLDLISINDCLGKTNETLDLISKANQTNKTSLKNLQNQVAALSRQLDGLEAELEIKQTELANRNQDFDQEYNQFSNRVRSFYMTSYLTNPMSFLLGSHNILEMLKLAHTYSYLSKRNKEIIANLVTSIADLQKEKEMLAGALSQTSSLKAQIDKETDFLAGEVAKAEKYEQQLGAQIAALSARQQEILTSKSGNFTASVGDSELADDYNASIKGFRESAPGGSFAVFSFGAFTHRKGMSQYGARGRAESGQNYHDILKAYYSNKDVTNKDTAGTISVAGFGDLDFESTYLYGIAEMPSNWHTEALKAQAVAARTYAFRYKQNGSTICTDEGCQVFNINKANNPPDAWRQAVNETRGQVLEDVVTYYASTHGAFANPIGWDTTDGAGGSNFFDKSYEKIGGSPWAYKAWYTQGYSVNSDKCGRSNPWLSSEEMADIINAAKYRDERVTPITTSCWGGNPYSLAELREKANGPSSVSSVTTIQGDGFTSEVVFQTDKGEVRLSGADFKTAFNLRAPGFLKIPQTGFTFFNIEKK